MKFKIVCLNINFILKIIVIFFIFASKFNADNTVCTSDLNNFSSAKKAHKNNKQVMHCGYCGACSNIDDIKIYYDTRHTLTNISRNCSLHLLKPFSGQEKVKKCMQKKVNLSPECLECWLNNMKCTKKNCLSICLLAFLSNSNNLMRRCFLCDELKCGPEFLKCAGANRRNCGITTDIQRENISICKDSDFDWSTGQSLL